MMNHKEHSNILDVFDENYKHLGTETYHRIHKKGLWHHNFHCWVVNPKTKKVLIILLSDKDFLMPKKLDIAIFGQMLAGEDVMHGKREIEEKFGIRIPEKNLVKIGITKESCFIKERKIFHRVFSHSYLLKKTIPIKNYVKKVKHIDAVFETPIHEALALFSDKKKEILLTGYTKDNEQIEMKATYEDFALRGKSYLHKTLFMIDSWLDMEEWEQNYGESNNQNK